MQSAASMLKEKATGTIWLFVPHMLITIYFIS